MSHDLSLGELQALALKAARGAGYSFGMAEEAGFAVHWLSGRGYDGAGHLAALLRAGAGGAEACPLHLGAAMSDAGIVPEGDLPPVHSPMLLVPFVASLCGPHGAHSVGAGAEQMRVDATGAVDGAPLPVARAAVRIRPCAAPEPLKVQMRAHVSDAALATLTDFAFRTYAPATAASRAKGAGAGLSDND